MAAPQLEGGLNEQQFFFILQSHAVLAGRLKSFLLKSPSPLSTTQWGDVHGQVTFTSNKPALL
jgi:hypothetical protein